MARMLLDVTLCEDVERQHNSHLHTQNLYMVQTHLCNDKGKLHLEIDIYHQKMPHFSKIEGLEMIMADILSMNSIQGMATPTEAQNYAGKKNHPQGLKQSCA